MVPSIIGNVELHFLSLQALLTISFLCLSTYAVKTVCCNYFSSLPCILHALFISYLILSYNIS